MDTIEIKDAEINVEEIMCKIRKNIKKRRESGTFTPEMDALVNEPLQSHNGNTEVGDLQTELDYIKSNCDVHADYSIRTHRPILGRPLVWGRKLIHGEVKRYVDLIADKQTEFNSHVVQSLIQIEKNEKELSNRLDTIEKELSNRLDTIEKELSDRINKNEEDLKGKISKNVNDKVSKVFDLITKDIENKVWLANLLDRRLKLFQQPLQSTAKPETLDINYFIFKEHIGRSWNKLSGESVQGVPNIFDDALNLFKEGKNILEIGCGEGQFLQMLKEKSIQGYGIDINEDSILYCGRKELIAQQVDVLTHLKSLQDKTLDGVFAAHVIEHMQSYELKQLLELCYAKMQFGSHIILVTPNILNISVSSNTFYMDPTHLNHIHPEVLKFLLESCGFRDIQERFYQPVPDELKLKKIDYNSNAEDKKIHETMNYNTDILNNLLFGYRDLAIIAKK